MSRIQVLTPLLACLASASPVRADEQARGQETWMSFPRLQEAWERPGLGLRAGVAGANTYYALTDDGKAVVALDGTTGRDRWRHQLAEPVQDDAEGMHERGPLGLLLGEEHRPLVLAGSDLLVATQRRFETVVNLTSLDARTGQLRWSRAVGCQDFRVQGSDEGWIIRCDSGYLSQSGRMLVLSAKNGAQRAELTMKEAFAVAPGGDVCASRNDRIGCFRLVRGRLVQRWSRSVDDARRPPEVFTTSSSVVRIGDGLQAYRLTDGRLVFERPAPIFATVDARHERLFLFGGGQVEVVQLKGGTGSTFPWQLDRPPLPKVVQGERFSLVLPSRWKAGPLGLVDGQGQLLAVESRGAEIDDLVGDTALEHTGGLTAGFERKGILRGYSIVQLAPPAATLDEYSQTVAVLEHYQMAFSAVDNALTAVRSLPHGMDRLEQAISQETGWTQLAAIRVAESSHSTRYLAVLRRLLGRLSLSPQNHIEERVLLAALRTMAGMENLRAAEELFAFWQVSESRIPDTHLRQHLQQEVLRAVWRYSADRDWQSCPERSFPVNAPSPNAILGGEGPGEASLADAQRRWVVLCQARHDDDGDGRLLVQTLEHGGYTGDGVRPYLVLGSGPGTEVDDAYAAPKGNHLVVAMGACLYDVDTRNGKASVLPRADGRARAGESDHFPAVTFSSDGTYLAYLRSRGQGTTLVVRDVQSGHERATDLGMARVGGVQVDSLARTVVLEVAEAPTPDTPWVEWTVWGPREPLCQSYGTIDGRYTLKLPKPSFHWRQWPIAGAQLRDGTPEALIHRQPLRESFESPRDLLVPLKGAHRQTEGLPSGPFRWRPAE